MTARRRQIWIRNSGLNLLGQLVPIVVGFATIPQIIHGLGHERFSLLTLAWAALGYFTLFDLGFGRATTKFTAEHLAHSRAHEINSLFWSSTTALLVISTIGSIILMALAPLAIGNFQDVSTTVKPEVQSALIVLALSLPLLTLTANARGMLEAQGKFLAINILQIVVGALSYLSPLVLLAGEKPLFNVVTALVAIRALSLFAHVAFCFRSLPIKLGEIRIRRETIRELWSFGGWLTVSNTLGPALYYFDRFALGLIVPVQQVGFYTTPMEAVTKLWIIPSSVTRVLFPEFSAKALSSAASFKSLYLKSSVALAIVMALPCGILLLAAEALLSWWIGPEFASQSAPCLRILALGVWINSVAWVPFTLLQGLGETRLIAFLHMAELIPYIIVFVALTGAFGLEGAAWAWTIRVTADALLMFILANQKQSASALQA